MAKAKIKIKASAGASGTKLATGTLRVVRTGGKPRVAGRPVYQTSAQLHARIHTVRNGQPRAS